MTAATDPLDRLLRDDLNRLTDRLAVAGRSGPLLRGEATARLDELEHRLTELRLAMLDRYAQWQAALDACEDLGVLGRLKGEGSSRSDLRAA